MAYAALLQHRKTIINNLNFHCGKASKLDENTNIFEVSNRKDTIEKLCLELQDVIQQCQNHKHYIHVDAEESENLQVLDKALVTISHVQSLIARDDSFNHTRANRTIFEVPVTATKPEIKLPNINVPKFSGEYEDWLTFHDYFNTVIHSNDSLNNLQKLHYLRHYLTEKPLRLISHLPITSLNYVPAWNLLTKRYHNTRVLVNYHLRRIRNQPKLTSEDSGALKQLIDVTNESLAAIKALKIDTDSWDPWVIFEIVEKLDCETRKGWEHHLNGSTKVPSLTQLNDYLEIRFRILEEIQPNQEPNHSTIKNRDMKPKVSHAAATKSNACHKCTEDHWIYFCPEFHNMSICERQRYVVENALCTNCLNNNHTYDECKSRYSCRICQEKHNTLLHVNQISVISNVDQSNTSSNPFETNASAEFSHNTFTTKGALLATALVSVKSSNGQNFTLKALIDQGSQTTFVTNRVRHLLNLPVTAVEIPIMGIGNNIAEKITQSTSFNIQSLVNPDFSLNIEALAMTTISKVRPPERARLSDWKHLNGIKLADPTCCTPGKIDILLGAEVFSQIILPGLRRGPANSPIAQNTELGWIISGPVTESKPIGVPLEVNHSCIGISNELKIRGNFCYHSHQKQRRSFCRSTTYDHR